ncbi:hypothetical protein B0H63DRAFT_476708 [Podospora didyma]|uniref:Uncharacterized protein n=1 Tax=Podospora didyma TaxID=330526 RepID=A0AAE0TW64_9PEZI|nr:hypothetical protein B0H63DRAFT_476708 [Podospora didyma]
MRKEPVISLTHPPPNLNHLIIMVLFVLEPMPRGSKLLVLESESPNGRRRLPSRKIICHLKHVRRSRPLLKNAPSQSAALACQLACAPFAILGTVAMIGSKDDDERRWMNNAISCEEDPSVNAIPFSPAIIQLAWFLSEGSSSAAALGREHFGEKEGSEKSGFLRVADDVRQTPTFSVV